VKSLLISVLLILSVAINGYAQTDPCATAIPPFTVNSGAPFTISWLMTAQVPASPTDPTLVNQRIDGYYVQVDLGTRTRIVPANYTVGAACLSTSPNPGKIPTTYRTVSGVSRGSHTYKIVGFNFVLDANGNPTTTEQEGTAVVIPFVAADLIHITPPLIPNNPIIRK